MQEEKGAQIMKDVYKLTPEDLEDIAAMLDDYIANNPHTEKQEEYPIILQIMAETLKRQKESI